MDNKTFGNVKTFNVLANKKTALNVNYNDNYIILFEHENENFGSLAIDVMSRKPVRNLEIFGENIYLSWNGTPDGLKRYNYADKKEENISLYNEINKNSDYASFIIENAYESELRTFLDQIYGKDKSRYTFGDDLKVISLINQIEKN